VKASSLRDLYIEQLRDLYDAENQLIKALPKMADEATSEDLRSGLEEHLEVTRQQASRLEQIFNQLGEKPKGEKCKGMEGLIKEGSDVLSEDMDEDVKDAAIIAAAQRVEHYEIAGYGTVRTYANLLGEEEAVKLLEQSLEEEKEADQTLNDIAEHINMEAQGAEGEEEEEQRPARRGTRTTRRRSAA
jgi:ferritin-like metal-binding protein YciE